MPVPMPAAVVLIVCKTVVAGPMDQNAAYTGYENREWATEHSMMVCRRQEVQLYDQAEAMGAAAQPFNLQRCQRSGIMLGTQWDAGHRGSSYRFWRVACPVPIVDTRTGDIIAWKMPECGHRDTVRCEVDAEI
jgi:Ni/Co efflux regulator RcnB